MRRIPRQLGSAALSLCCAAVLVLLLAVQGASAATDRHNISGRRAALVIGNSDYSTLEALPAAVGDAERVSKLLRDANFEVTLGADLDKQGMERTVREFLRTLEDGDVALFYYAGHAVQVAGENYIIPVDASLTSAYDLEVQSYNVTNLLGYMREASSLQILILDSCRDNPFKDRQYFVGDRTVAADGKDGLAALTPRLGSLVVYSTAPDSVAYDGGAGQSPFSGALAEHLLTPNVEVRDLVTRIRADVIQRTGGRQVPWDASSLTSQFYFVSRQNLLITGDSLTELRVSPQVERVALGIPQPIATKGMEITAYFDRLPEAGELRLGDQAIGAGTSFDARRLHEVSYLHRAGDKPVDMMSYVVRAETGQEVKGMVAIVFDPAIAPDPVEEKPEQAAPEIVAGLTITPVTEEETGPQRALRPVEIAMAPVVGTGFVSISDALPDDSGLGDGWLRVAARNPSTQIAVGEQILSAGDLVRAEDLRRLSVRPALRIWSGEEDGPAEIVLAQAGDGANEAPRLVIDIAPAIHRCDELAGDRLDVQGVVEGVFPNDIRLAEALPACREAVETFPDIARFRHQLGRVLYAQGEYAAAIEEFQTALEGGHVRSGEVLGRMYQYGAGMAKEPEKAIPLFEAASARGDAYAQQSLAKSLMEGNGAAPDAARSIELYAKAVEAGHTYAMNGLGGAYRSGEHVKQDLERAFRLFSISAERGDVWGKVNLGQMYRDGQFVEKDERRALELFREGHEGLHPYAGTLIALMTRDNPDANAREIFDLFRTSGERGDSFGAYYAADMITKNASFGAEDEAIRFFALSIAVDGRSNAAKSSRARLEALPTKSLVAAAQRALIRLGGKDVEADGIFGPRSRQIAADILGREAPADPVDLLIAIIDHEWIAAQPRFDML